MRGMPINNGDQYQLGRQMAMLAGHVLLNLGDAARALANRRPDAIRARIPAANDHDVQVPRALMVGVQLVRPVFRERFCPVRWSSAKCTPASLRPGTVMSPSWKSAFASTSKTADHSLLADRFWAPFGHTNKSRHEAGF